MKKQLFRHGKPIRLISKKRAQTLYKKGVYTFYSQEHYSVAWYLEDLLARRAPTIVCEQRKVEY